MKKQEREKILQLKQQGYGNKQIADELNIPVNTVKSFLRRRLSEEGNFCRTCGIPIEQTAHRKLKKFCSDKCRMTWWNAHKTELNKKSEIAVVCGYCGKEFMSYPSKKRKYCSRSCSILANKKGQNNG